MYILGIGVYSCEAGITICMYVCMYMYTHIGWLFGCLFGILMVSISDDVLALYCKLKENLINRIESNRNEMKRKEMKNEWDWKVTKAKDNNITKKKTRETRETPYFYEKS